MEWFIAVLAVAALGVAAMAAAGGMGQMSKDPVYDVYRQDLPETPLTAADLDTLRFGVALRGYAMGQVDDILERLGREIGERDARIAELTASQEERSTGAVVAADSVDSVDRDEPTGVTAPEPAYESAPEPAYETAEAEHR